MHTLKMEETCCSLFEAKWLIANKQTNKQDPQKNNEAVFCSNKTEMLENAGLHADTSHIRGFTCLAQRVCGCVRVLEHI